jgi:hypothetical protein
MIDVSAVPVNTKARGTDGETRGSEKDEGWDARRDTRAVRGKQAHVALRTARRKNRQRASFRSRATTETEGRKHERELLVIVVRSWIERYEPALFERASSEELAIPRDRNAPLGAGSFDKGVVVASMIGGVDAEKPQFASETTEHCVAENAWRLAGLARGRARGCFAHTSAIARASRA